MHPLLPSFRLRCLARRGTMPLTAAFCASLWMALWACEARAQACVPEDCQPSPNSAYSGTSHYSFSFLRTTIDLGDLVLHAFTSCGSLPPSVPGSTTLTSFNALMDFTASVNGGPAVPGQAPANATIVERFDGSLGPTRTFHTEMVQLDLSGGTLPLGAMVRESPTLASSGQTQVQDLGGGTFRVDSFFDVFFELSLDGGVSWAPQLSGPGTMTLTGPTCPT